MLQQFVRAYNKTVHTALGMAPAAVTDKHVLEIYGLVRMKIRLACV